MNKNICLLSIIMVFADLSGMEVRAVSGSSDTFFTPTEIEFRNDLKGLPVEDVMRMCGFSVEKYLPLSLSQREEIRRLFANYRMPVSEKQLDRIKVAKSEYSTVGYHPIPDLFVVCDDSISPDSKIPEAVKVYQLALGLGALTDSDMVIRCSQEAASCRAELFACRTLKCPPCIEKVAAEFKGCGISTILKNYQDRQDIIRRYELQALTCIKCKEAAWKESQLKVRELR